MEEPGHKEALTRLAELHESRGEIGEALALLTDALREAESRGDEAWRGETVRSLGDLLKQADPAQAKEVYRQALASTIADANLRRELQNNLFDLLGAEEADEKANLAERMLADEQGQAAADRASALADLRRATGDQDGEKRALLIGRERAPESTVLF